MVIRTVLFVSDVHGGVLSVEIRASLDTDPGTVENSTA